MKNTLETRLGIFLRPRTGGGDHRLEMVGAADFFKRGYQVCDVQERPGTQEGRPGGLRAWRLAVSDSVGLVATRPGGMKIQGK